MLYPSFAKCKLHTENFFQHEMNEDTCFYGRVHLSQI